MKDKVSKTRSPQYPYIGLKAAVDRTQELHTYAKRNAVSINGVFKHWGYSGDTGSARKTLAALKYFGLVEQPYGSKEVKLTDRALRIVLDHEGSQERKTAIQSAFLSPKLYRYLWDKYKKDGLPHDNAIRSHLIFDKGFNESTVDSFIEDFKQSMKFAEMTSGDSISAEDETNTEIKVGDWIQWESQGVLQFSEPRQVTDLSDDGEFLFVAGSNTGIPLDEAEIVDAPDENETAARNAFVKPIAPKGENVLQDVYNIPKGEGQIVIQFPGSMSEENFDDFTDWLILQHRKMGRSVEGNNIPKLERKDVSKKE